MTDQLPERREPTPEGLVAKWDRLLGGASFEVVSSLPSETREQRALIMELVEGESLAGGELIGSELALVNYIAHPVELTNEETGEVANAIRIVLIMADGMPVSFVSTGVLKSLQRIVWQERRMPPFDPPVRVRLKQVAVRGKGRTYKLMPVKE